jgi:hypothetical protein
MDRKSALVALRVAGYHEDMATWVRVYVENRVSRTAADAEWSRGKAMKAAGVGCSCPDCKRQAAAGGAS